MASGIVLLLASLFSFIFALIALGFLSVGAWTASTLFVLATVFGIYFLYRQWSSSEPEEAEPVDIVKKIQKIEEKTVQIHNCLDALILSCFLVDRILEADV